MTQASANLTQFLKRPRRRLHEVRPSEQAGIVCNQPWFWRFLMERKRVIALSPRQAAEAVYELCGVSSRRELTPRSEAAERWHELKAEFDLWSRDL